MTTKYLIVRGDDFGNSLSSSEAIMAAHSCGLLRNASVMVTCPAVREAARKYAGTPGLVFGLHATLTSEWDNVRWGPVLPAERVSSLVRRDGTFCQDGAELRSLDPKPEHMLAELQEQLHLARRLGFDIRYADTHMGFEWVAEGFAGMFDEWCMREGLVSYRSIPRRLPDVDTAAHNDPVERLIARLEKAEPGLYTLVTHPAYNDRETRAFGNEVYSGGTIADERDGDRRMLTDGRLLQYIKESGIRPVTYVEAAQLAGA
ncbi:MAG: YdjC-like protein [Paenibacillaceae bacterium]|jgi:predicted glycoside hydrolase/deacetylase ChbG (UPF0249 family)|nr:YdjC-like protein [Paenibacillaceae bacterium]